jgi:hypothetical protein
MAVIAYLNEATILDEEKLALKKMCRNRKKFHGDQSREKLEYFLSRFIVYSHDLN